MSFDDYARRMAQKYRLAISLAVINTRPENVSLEDYIEQLRNSINNDQIDFDNISLSSDDFNMYETEFDNKTDESNDKSNLNNVHNDAIYQNADELASTKDKIDDGHINIDKYHRYQNNDGMVETNDEQVFTQNVHDSITISQNLDMKNGEVYEITNQDTSSSLKDIIDFIKDIDTNMTTIEMDVQTENLSQSTFYDSLRAPSVIMDTQCLYDSDATFCNSLTCLDNFGMCQELNNSAAENNNMEQKEKTQLLSQGDKKEMYQKYDHKTVQQNPNDKAYYNKNYSANYGLHHLLTSNKDASSKRVENENKRDFQYETDFVWPKSNTNNIEEEQTIDKNLYETTFVNLDSDNTSRNNVGSDKEKEKYIPKNNFEKYKLPIERVSEISKDSQNKLTQNTDYFDSHYTESQKDIIIIDDKYIHGIKNIQKLKKLSNDVNKCHDEQDKSKLSTDMINSKNIVIHIDKDVSKESHSTSRIEYKILEQDPNKEVNKPKNKVIHIDNDMFSQETQFMTISNSAQNSGIGYNVTSDKNLQSAQNAQQIGTYFDQSNENHSSRNNFVLTNEKKQERNEIHNKCDDVHDRNNHIFAKNCSQVSNSHNTNVNSILKSRNHLNPSSSAQNCENKKDKRGDEISAIERDTDCTNFEDNSEEAMEEELTDSQIELIPFKVIEELNKVKVFLNRNDNGFSKDGCSSDSGYRSRSKSSLKMTQSDGGLNQAAHSLVNYILECPLVKTNSDVTTEISVVLGQLVDKLHEEENYPTFLEELLEAVRLLLRLIYEESAYDDTFMKKEDDIQRLLLLNKSIHIQKYTIEKITNILETVYTELTTKDIIYEIENITKIENLSHIFHILETILKNKISQNFSQTSSQNSQDDKLLKKSNITDVWRKKWNPNYKEVENVGSCEKKCVIQSCSAILNKLVVNCMEGYSLVSYFALKCFNALQTEK